MTELRNAGIVSRVIAAGLDVLVVFGLQIGIYLSVVLVRFALDVRAFELPDYPWVWGTSAFLVLSVGYLTIAWAAFGRTVGQFFLGVAVISRRSLGKVRLPRALGRALLCTFFPVGLLWVVISSRRWSVADIVCFTRVVYTHDVLPESSVVEYLHGQPHR